MTSTFKNARLAVTTSIETVYTCPSATTAIIFMAQAANVNGVNDSSISLQWIDSSNNNNVTRLVDILSVQSGISMGLIDGKMVLEAGDYLQAKASAINNIELTISVLELT